MTIGRDNDPADLGPLPGNAIVERFIAQGVLLPRMSVMVSHAGSGSMLAALTMGLPLLMLPSGADQYENARACAARGVARVLMPDELDIESARQGLTTILSEPSYRECAAAVRDEIAAMPTADDVAEAVSRATL
ncbi:MAG TPA: nucleotide disphospho-sugar-binding domain-containing protein [Gaiellaceae bacterium]|jgi:UDP:flavonoid glycosyltransferase YjiC (YdhE family)